MTTTYTLTQDEEKLCKALGEIIIRWNNIEALVRHLLYATIGPERPGHRTDVMIAHLQNVAIVESLTAIADDYDGLISNHMKHCAKLFDSLRVYRNHFAHDPITFCGGESGERMFFAQSISAKGGALRLSQGDIRQKELDDFLDKIEAFRVYVSDIIDHLYDAPRNRTPLSSLQIPPLPDKLEKPRLNLIERKRQHQSQQE